MEQKNQAISAHPMLLTSFCLKFREGASPMLSAHLLGSYRELWWPTFLDGDG
ncbi:hypothetical protein CLV98_104219 [Dyadobacter jejuensis]|uniref:Uncharacterized protein n=1 Tax=Dyadobacter jejuensis TaxID=1082580 RepID=A0A316ANK0_9BACT|nr:hypothetical protein [Dyadobacter jejuensis]PWJ58360.1 hypothetical protein CLV98_104219 [Dyadobacter jejuensis]